MFQLVAVPDSALATSAAALANTIEPPFLVRHSERTFQLGVQLLGVAGQEFDSELLYVASMLHDIALGTSLDDGVTPFHFKGGGVAAKHVLDGGRSAEDASMIFDAVALHMDLSTGNDARREVADVHLGAAADDVGFRLDQIDPQWLETLVAASPRLSMKVAFAGVISAEARGKPYSAAAQLLANFGFLDLIGAAPFEE